MSYKNDEISQKQLRLKAEEQPGSTVPTKKPAHTLSFNELLHELRVHQIELEMRHEELRRIYTALEVSHAHYIELYDFAPVGYLTLTGEGLITEINLTAAKMLGVERKLILNRRFERFIGQGYKDLWCRHFQQAKQKKGLHGCELPFLFKSNTTCYYHLDCVNINADGTPSQMKVTLTDVTERKKAEIKFRENEAIFATLIEYAPSGIYVVNSQFQIQHVNTQALPIFESIQPLIGRDLSEVMSILWGAEVGGQITGIFRHTLKTGEKFSTSNFSQLRHDLGMERTYEWEIQRITLPDSQQGVACYFADITERKKIEETLHIAAAAFQAQESILVTDARRVIVRVNKAFTRITGYSAEEAVGKTPAILRSGLHDKAFYDAVLDTVASEGFWEGEIWNKRKNGEFFPVLQTISAVTNEQGQITHYVGAMMDITAQKQAEKVLLDARQRLEYQVASTQEEMEKIKTETLEINAALTVLIKHREADRVDAQLALSQEVEATVLPLLKKLKTVSSGRVQSTKLIGIVEASLQQLVKSYGRAANLAAAYQKLTPIETQVASMIRQGLPTKSIATTLSISSGTVSIHRKHIRKKLGLDGKEINLQSHLQSLAE